MPGVPDRVIVPKSRLCFAVNVRDLTIQAVNPGYALLLGKRNVVGQPLTDFFDGPDLEKLIEIFGEVAETGKPFTTDPMSVRASDYRGEAEDQFVHTIVPIHGKDGSKARRLFIYTEKV